MPTDVEDSLSQSLVVATYTTGDMAGLLPLDDTTADLIKTTQGVHVERRRT